jgi:hypothetical protein
MDNVFLSEIMQPKVMKAKNIAYITNSEQFKFSDEFWKWIDELGEMPYFDPIQLYSIWYHERITFVGKI